MNSPKVPPATLATPEEAEQQFYEALQHGELDRLMAVWGDEDEICCVHPAGPRLIGAVAIRESFGAIFSQGVIDVHPERVVRLQTPFSAVHSVLERVQMPVEMGIQSNWVVATNVYLKTPLGWRMVAHHASPGSPHEVHEMAEMATVLH
jgi:ketosteroid isomerase-like protein